jgi:glutamyl/glutaminyl-tRNA synthetase
VIYNTRLVPTISGLAHCGHLMAALVNEAEAKASGGHFTVRLDDNQPEQLLRNGPDAVTFYGAAWMADFDWMGIEPEEYFFQSAWSQRVDMHIAYFNHGPVLAPRPFQESFFPEIPYCDSPYPFAPHITAEAVISDYLQENNLIITGEDLLSRYSLYAYFCELWGLPQPRQVFIPRLRLANGGELTDVSKTLGNFKISDLRDQGHTADEIRGVLAEACLIDPAGLWLVTNLKQRPVLEAGALGGINVTNEITGARHE